MENHHFLWENSLKMAIFHCYVSSPEGNVNPGLINPKRLFNWEDTIKKKVLDEMTDYWRSTPLIHKPWFVNPGLT